MGVIAKVANALTPDWRTRLDDQTMRLREHVPLAADEAHIAAEGKLQQLREVARALGYNMRAQQRDRQGVSSLVPASNTFGIPGREHLISLPAQAPVEKVALLGAITGPLRNAAEDLKLELQSAADNKRRAATRVTSDPMTIPTFAPSVALSVPSAFAGGYQSADQELDSKAKADIDAQIEAAKQEFEHALHSEYSGRKVANAGELIDALADHFLTKTAALTKASDGELNKALGMYLAAAALMGQGAHATAKNWVEGHDPRHQRAKALSEAIRQKAHANPAPILVAPPMPVEEMPEPGIPGAVEKLAVLEQIPAAVDALRTAITPLDLNSLAMSLKTMNRGLPFSQALSNAKNVPGDMLRGARDGISRLGRKAWLGMGKLDRKMSPGTYDPEIG